MGLELEALHPPDSRHELCPFRMYLLGQGGKISMWFLFFWSIIFTFAEVCPNE